MHEVSAVELLREIKRVVQSCPERQLNHHIWYNPISDSGCIAGHCANDKWFQNEGLRHVSFGHSQGNHTVVYNHKTSWDACLEFFKPLGSELCIKLFGHIHIKSMPNKNETIDIINQAMAELV